MTNASHTHYYEIDGLAAALRVITRPLRAPPPAHHDHDTAPATARAAAQVRGPCLARPGATTLEPTPGARRGA